MTEFQSLIFYLFSFALSAALVYFGTKHKFKIFIIIGLAIPILLAGLRIDTGTDYANYIRHHVVLNEYGIKPPLEPTFQIFSRLSYILSNGATLLLLIYAAITVIFFYLGLRAHKCKYIALTFFLFLVTIYPQSLNIMRQMAAVSVFFFATTFITKQKPKKYLLFTIIASTLHYAAIVLLPLYLVSKIGPVSIHNRRCVRALFLAIIGTLVGIVVVTTPIATYLLQLVNKEYHSSMQFNSMNAVIQLLPNIGISYLLLRTAKNVQHKYSETSIFYWLILLSICIGMISIFLVSIKRLSLFLFFPFVILILERVIRIKSPDHRKALYLYGSLAAGLIYFVVLHYLLSYSHIFPYQSILGALTS